MPLANDYIISKDTKLPKYPLHVMVCDQCFLAQIHHAATPESIFKDYAYFSSYSSSWLSHAHNFSMKMIDYLGLDAQSFVIEVASNDGYLLRNFVAKGIPCLGIEPAANVAATASDAGIPTEVAFLNEELALRLSNSNKKADLLIANNVIAHVPDLNDFIKSLALILKPHGVLSLEFPDLLSLIKKNAFDTIYHEHYSYFSLHSLELAIKRQGLRIYSAEKLATHGGSLRVLVCHEQSVRTPLNSQLENIRTEEINAGLHTSEGYNGFASQVDAVKRELNSFLIAQSNENRKVIAYGAAAKGNTLLNVCGITGQQINCVVDLNPLKQGRFLPGSCIPIYSPQKVLEEKPDFLLILPWNIAEEIKEQMQYIRSWGGRFVTAFPHLQIWD